MSRNPGSFSAGTYLVRICIFVLIVYLTLNIDHIMVFLDELNVGSKVQPQKKVEPFCNVTLMGQFNYISKNITRWSTIWSEHIQDIVIATPENTPIDNHTHGKVMFYKKDRGKKSPYSNILKVLKERNSINCLLYVHDDLLVTGSILRRLGRQEWISTVYTKTFFESTSESDQVITLYRNGTAFAHGSWSLDKWPWWPGCRSAFINMFTDKVVKPYLKKSKTLEDFINVRIGQSDMLYLTLSSSEQRLWLLNVFELFGKHSIFLECAIPTAVFWMKKRFQIKVYNANLCTDWGGLRGTPGLMFEHCNNESMYNVFHPIKMGLIANWTDYFNAITG